MKFERLETLSNSDSIQLKRAIVNLDDWATFLSEFEEGITKVYRVNETSLMALRGDGEAAYLWAYVGENVLDVVAFIKPHLKSWGFKCIEFATIQPALARLAQRKFKIEQVRMSKKYPVFQIEV